MKSGQNRFGKKNHTKFLLPHIRILQIDGEHDCELALVRTVFAFNAKL